MANTLGPALLASAEPIRKTRRYGNITHRELNREDLDMFMGRRVVDDAVMAPFIDLACLHRILVAHLAMVLCCCAVDCVKSAVVKQTKTSGCAGDHWDQTRAFNKLIIILGIKNLETGEWLDRRSSGPTSCGVDVFTYLSGSQQDDPFALPARYDLLRQGDAMILRSSRYKSRTVPPPAGFEVYKYVIWFNTHALAQDHNCEF